MVQEAEKSKSMGPALGQAPILQEIMQVQHMGTEQAAELACKAQRGCQQKACRHTSHPQLL